jgi:hypothetical protein
MSGVFRPPPPLVRAGGGHIRWVERGWGVNSSEDARHCSVLYICKYFVSNSLRENKNFFNCVQGLTVLCGSSTVRLVSSGNYDNSVSVFVKVNFYS